MPSATPFADPATGKLDTAQIITEARPIAKLIGVFVAVSLVPFGLGFFAAPSALSMVFFLFGQFILAVGAGVVLLYIITRGIELSES